MVLWLGGGVDDKRVASLAAEHGVAVRAVSPMYAGGNGPMGLILGLGGFSDEEIEIATGHLARCIDTVARDTSRDIQPRPAKKTTRRSA